MAADPMRFDEYICESLLGEGGMGRVFRARQVALDRWVALKILPRAKENQTFIDRFYREARSAARLLHPNIIQIYTVGEKDGIPYFAMEYVEGEDVEHLLRPDAGDPFTVDEVIEIVRSVAKALAMATEHGIVHRDIKPANIMVTRSGVVKVMDFGLAKGAATDHSLTQQGLIVGTPAYMSPEQGASKGVDARSDIYSLGCVMYECLAGKQPFGADSVASLIFKHMYENPEPLANVRPDVPPEVESICQKMMAKNPADRHQTPSDLLEALAQVPVNSSLAEISLAKRVQKMIAARKPKAATAIKPEDLGLTPKNGAEAPAAAAPAAPPPPPPPPVAHATPAPRNATPSPIPAHATPLPPAPKPSSANPHLSPMPRPATAARAELTPIPAKRPSGTLGTPIPGSVPPPPVSSSGSRSPVPAIVSRTRGVHEAFVKLADGRWAYKLDLGRCPFAEGLAAEAPTPISSKPEGLGDCLLCSNWNKRSGCAVAYSQELDVTGRYRGLRLAAEQAIAFAGAQRYDKAINTLDAYVKTNPDDPEGYRELARIYDRPEYKGKDKRRAIVLYQRFIELARRVSGFSAVEITRAEERVSALKTATPDTQSGSHAGIGIPFACFYRGGIICFGFGLMTGERLILARAGDVDPESGIQASEMGGAVTKATSIFRRFKSEAAKKEEQAQVKKELLRLSNLAPDQLQRDPARVLSIAFDQIVNVGMTVDNAVGIRCIKISTQQGNHDLLFTESGAYRADQCYALIQRKRGI
ncbi:MAG TPA: protein kinase [Planctomycetota bacterium]|nr:protein kinase [Planctomycetota bacterium]